MKNNKASRNIVGGFCFMVISCNSFPGRRTCRDTRVKAIAEDDTFVAERVKAVAEDDTFVAERVKAVNEAASLFNGRSYFAALTAFLKTSWQ